MTPILAEQSPWSSVASDALAGIIPDRQRCRQILNAPDDELLPLLNAAFQVRKQTFGRRVQIHVLENAKLGACPEDCGFCPQSAAHGNPSGLAPIEQIEELVEGARRAARAQAKRYCMATATRGPSTRDLDIICEATRRIKDELDIEVCASLGILNDGKAKRLAEAGVDRFNHNLESSERFFSRIVSTHTWQDRVQTVETARRAGMSTCCGGIVGMGEKRTTTSSTWPSHCVSSMSTRCR